MKRRSFAFSLRHDLSTNSGPNGFALDAPVFPKLKFGQQDDPLEQDARRKEEEVRNTPAFPSNKQKKQSLFANVQTTGNLPDSITQDPKMQHLFGAAMEGVQIHTDSRATHLNQQLQSRAFTQGKDIYFNQGEYNPDSLQGRQLLAHELTHVSQQRSGRTNQVQTAIELRPPGKGEASAFERAQELIDRMNEVSMGVSYRLEADGRTLSYQILLQEMVSEFDQQMMDFIDLEAVIPLRLINSQGYVGGDPLFLDSFMLGYLDLDDLLASDALAFQSNMIHVLAERSGVRRYAQRIGTPGVDPDTASGERTFDRAHHAGVDAEARHWQDVTGDPSIEFLDERPNNRGDYHIIFRSQDHDYQIFITFDRAERSVTGRRPREITSSRTRVRHNGRFMSMDDFLDLGIVPGSPRDFRLRVPDLGAGRNRFRLMEPQLRLDPNIQGQVQNLLQLRPLLGAPTIQQSPGTTTTGTPGTAPSLPSLMPTPNFNPFSIPSALSGPNVNLIDWFAINNELTSRGVLLDEQMADSIVSVWRSNYSFFNQTLGFSRDRSVQFTNFTISKAVGSGLNRDYPTLMESSDRELDTSSLILPVSDIIMYLLDQ